MKKLLFIMGLIAIIMPMACEIDFEADPPKEADHVIKGVVSEWDTGLVLEGIELGFNECKLCWSSDDCTVRRFGKTNTLGDGTFRFNYYGPDCVSVWVTSPRVSVLDSNGYECSYPIYLEYELFGEKHLCSFVNFVNDVDDKYFDIKLIKNPNL